QRRVLDTGIQLVESPQCPVPVQETAQQVERCLDAVDMGLRFGAHGKSPSLKVATRYRAKRWRMRCCGRDVKRSASARPPQSAVLAARAGSMATVTGAAFARLALPPRHQ